MYKCPLCQSNSVGKIGSNQYYCWDCCIEFLKKKNNKVSLYEVADDGTLLALEDLKEVDVTL